MSGQHVADLFAIVRLTHIASILFTPHMAELKYSGATLVTTVLVLGGFTLAIFVLRLWFRISRRKYDASDTMLVAAVVSSLNHYSALVQCQGSAY